MTNPMYVHTSGVPVQSARGLSSAIRTELDLIEDGFDLAAPLASPALTGTPTVPTAAPGTTTTQAANAAFVSAAITLAYGSAYTNSTGTASDSVAIGTGAKSFTTQTGKNWVAGMFLVAFADAADYMLCTVTSYNSSTGALVLDSVGVLGSGTFASWSFFSQPYPRYPIFSKAAAAVNFVSSSEVMENELVATGLSATAAVPIICNGNSLFLAASAASQSNIASSPDADTWTLRAMPSGAIWQPATNGTTGFVASVPSATTTAKSTDGTTWVAGTALGGTAHATCSLPAYNGSTALVIASAATTCYTSPDNGATWNAQTLPAAAGANPFVVNSLFFMWQSGTTYWTSATGATGSWTSLTIPITPTILWQDFDGAMMALTGTVIYRCTNGIDWVAITPATTGANIPVLTINGVYGAFSETYGVSGTYHANGWALRKTSHPFNGAAGYRVAKNTGSTVFAIPSTNALGKVMRINPTAADAVTGIFSR